MSGSLTSVPVVSLLTFCLLRSVWAVDNTDSSPVCRTLPADVMWLLDKSASMSADGFKQVKEFVKRFAREFGISPEGMNMGVVTFSSTARAAFFLNRYSTTAAVVAAIDAMNYTMKGLTKTYNGLALIRTEAFTEAHGDRKDIPNILIVVTDGASSNQSRTATEAAKIHGMNITVLTVGVGVVGPGELKKIASQKQDDFHVSNFNGLEKMIGNITGAVCKEVSPTPPTKTTPEISTVPPTETTPDRIPKPVDVVFLLDNSENTVPRNFHSIKQFMKTFADDFDLGPNGLRMGVVTFNGTPNVEFTLNSSITIGNLSSAINHIEYSGSDTPRMADALRLVREDSFTKARGGRDDAPDILIVIADGRVDDKAEVKEEAAEFKKTNISIFVVTLFQNITEEMSAIASKEENVFHVPNFKDLENVHSNLSEAVSEIISPTLPPTPAATPSPSSTPAPVYFHPQFPCVDSITSCAEYGFFHCNPGSLWALHICRKHCGVCVQHCDYKGQWYSHGAKWQDGCAYDCECVDGATGHYQCYSKCPTYLFLPPHCTLVQLPGLCCPQPTCDFGAIYQTTGGQKVGNLNGYQVCVYKGTKYHQGQKWTVECDTECSCYDAGIGLYTCQSKCAWYGMLPPNCRLIKKPGECCAKPECEFYTTMGPFIGVGQPSGNGQSVYTVFTF